MLKIEYLPTDDLVPYVNNSRTHTDSQVKQIAASIQEYGFTNPVLINEKGTIIAGHGRVMAAEFLDLDEVPTITIDNLTPAQLKAYVIADNKLALNASWNEDALQGELQALMDESYDLELLGFDAEELNAIIYGGKDPESPDDFKNIDESDLAHTCPKCGFEFDD